ncbi:MAG: DMT family transporter [Alphaproteobacteria bacterium]
MSAATSQEPTKWIGWAAVLFAAGISGSNYVVSRYGMKSAISANDMIALRIGIAGLVMLPLLWVKGIGKISEIGWRRGLILSALAGAPYSLMILWGLRYAPAAHGGVLVTATVPLIVAFGLWITMGVRVTGVRLLLLMAILIGITMVMGGFSIISDFSGPDVLFGDLLFVMAGAGMGVFSILLRRWRYDALLVSALVSVLSLAYLPVYFFLLDPDFSRATIGQILFHGFNQGILNAVAALFLFSYGVGILGPQRAVLGIATVPVIAALMAIPMLGELPAPIQWLGIALVVGSVILSAQVQDKAPIEKS